MAQDRFIGDLLEHKWPYFGSASKRQYVTAPNVFARRRSARPTFVPKLSLDINHQTRIEFSGGGLVRVTLLICDQPSPADEVLCAMMGMTV